MSVIELILARNRIPYCGLTKTRRYFGILQVFYSNNLVNLVADRTFPGWSLTPSWNSAGILEIRCLYMFPARTFPGCCLTPTRNDPGCFVIRLVYMFPARIFPGLFPSLARNYLHEFALLLVPIPEYSVIVPFPSPEFSSWISAPFLFLDRSFPGCFPSLSWKVPKIFSPSFLLFCIVMYCIVLYCIVFVLYCIVLYCIVFYCIVLYCILLYFIVLYCILLYCIVLHCIVLDQDST
jgi:hypothetical protein